MSFLVLLDAYCGPVLLVEHVVDAKDGATVWRGDSLVFAHIVEEAATPLACLAQLEEATRAWLQDVREVAPLCTHTLFTGGFGRARFIDQSCGGAADVFAAFRASITNKYSSRRTVTVA